MRNSNNITPRMTDMKRVRKKINHLSKEKLSIIERMKIRFSGEIDTKNSKMKLFKQLHKINVKLRRIYDEELKKRKKGTQTEYEVIYDIDMILENLVKESMLDLEKDKGIKPETKKEVERIKHCILSLITKNRKRTYPGTEYEGFCI